MTVDEPTTTVLNSGFRSDLADTQRAILDAVAEPGTWWTGAERVAIAEEVRRARANADRPPWDAPSAADGGLPADHPLGAAAVDAIWRIANHPGTLTADRHAEIVVGLPSPEHYVELVTLVARQCNVDRFSEVMGLALAAIPGARAGEPTRQGAVGATVSTHWVPTVPGDGPRVLKAMSSLPAEQPLFEAISAAQYVPLGALTGDLEWGRDTIDRRQIELVAAQTSLVNECFY